MSEVCAPRRAPHSGFGSCMQALAIFHHLERGRESGRSVAVHSFVFGFRKQFCNAIVPANLRESSFHVRRAIQRFVRRVAPRENLGPHSTAHSLDAIRVINAEHAGSIPSRPKSAIDILSEEI
jgi:hypothetical protein